MTMVKGVVAAACWGMRDCRHIRRPVAECRAVEVMVPCQSLLASFRDVHKLGSAFGAGTGPMAQSKGAGIWHVER
jgi:hypothetical protein